MVKEHTWKYFNKSPFFGTSHAATYTNFHKGLYLFCSTNVKGNKAQVTLYVSTQRVNADKLQEF